MVRFVTDENFNNAILQAIRRQFPDLDIVRVQDVGLTRSPDPLVLAWAADAGRILLTHDLATMRDFAYARMSAGLPIAGVFIIPPHLPISVVINELRYIMMCSTHDEWVNQVWYLPL